MPVAAGAEVPCLPLFRRGRWYASLDREAVFAAAGSALLSQAPAILLRDDLRAFRSAVAPQPPRAERERIVAWALERFASGTVEIDGIGAQGPEELRQALAWHCGLPSVLTDRWIGLLARETARLLAQPAPEVPAGTLVLVSLPSNTFVCLAACLDAVLRGAAVWMRPSRREPFTALRLAGCLLAAGWPSELLGVYPTARQHLALLARQVDRAVLYGGPGLAAELGSLLGVEVRGPGRARAIVTERCGTSEAVEPLLELVASDAGRFCTSIGTILCAHSAGEIGPELAARLDELPLAPEGERPLARWPEEGLARALVSWIEERIRPGDRLLTRRSLFHRIDGRAVLAPALVALGDLEKHPLLGVELPFPFAVLVDSSGGPGPDLLEGCRFLHTIQAGGASAFDVLPNGAAT